MTESDKIKVVRRLMDKNYGLYKFKLYLNGYGNTPEEAWENVVEGFCSE